jgi:hypothetical protein
MKISNQLKVLVEMPRLPFLLLLIVFIEKFRSAGLVVSQLLWLLHASYANVSRRRGDARVVLPRGARACRLPAVRQRPRLYLRGFSAMRCWRDSSVPPAL